MAPATGQTYAISVTEVARIREEYLRDPEPGDTYIADEDVGRTTETGLYSIAGGELRKVAIAERQVMPRVVIGAEAAHRLEVGRRELLRRARRQRGRNGPQGG